MSTNRKYLDLNGLAYYHSKLIQDIQTEIPEIPDIIVNQKNFFTELRLGNKPIKYINTATENVAGLMSPNDVSKLKECLRFQYVNEIEHHEATINDFNPGELIAQSQDNLYKIYLDKVNDDSYNAYVIKQDGNLNWKFVKIGSTSATENFILKTSTGSQGTIDIKTDSFTIESATGPINLEIVKGSNYPINLVGNDKINLYGNSLTFNDKNIVSKVGSVNYFGNPGDTFVVNSATPILRKKSNSEFYQVWDTSNLTIDGVKIANPINIQTKLENYSPANNNFTLEDGDTFQEAFAKLEGRINNLSPGENPGECDCPELPSWLNDYIDNAPEFGEKNVIETIKLNGNPLTPNNETINIQETITSASSGLKVENHVVKHTNSVVNDTLPSSEILCKIKFDEQGHIISYSEVTINDLAAQLLGTGLFEPSSDYVEVESVQITPASATLTDDNPTQKLSATTYGANNREATNQNVTWSSSDPSIVKVNDDGLITGQKTGTATITATSSNKKTESIEVIVQFSTAYYFSVGTIPVTENNYTTVNNPTTDIPITKEYINSGTRAFVYILVPSNKTVSVREKVLGGVVTVSEIASISGHKIYKTGSAVAQDGTIIITLN